MNGSFSANGIQSRTILGEYIMCRNSLRQYNTMFSTAVYFPTDQKPTMKLIGLIKYRIGAETKQCRPIDIISIEWEGIARALEVKEAEIASARNRPNNRGAANDIVIFWPGADTEATWAKLIDAIKVITSLTTSAEELETALLNMV